MRRFNGIAECKTCNQENCILKFCNSQSFEEIERRKLVESYERGRTIIHEGNPFRGIYVVHSGKIKVFRVGNNNKIQIIRLAGPGDIIGHRSLEQENYSISATALEDSCVVLLEAAFIIDLLKRDKELTYQMMLFYCKELQKSENRMKNLAQMSVREKVLESLVLVSDAFGVKTGEGILLDADLSRTDYGELSSLRSEQFIRIVTELKDEGLLRMRSDKKIILTNPNKIRHALVAYKAC